MLRVLIVLAVLALLACGVILYLPVYFFNFIVKRKDPLPGTAAYDKAQERYEGNRDGGLPRGKTLPWIFTQPCETVRLVSHDGLNLEGLFLSAFGAAPEGPGASGKANNIGNGVSSGTVILAHGYSGDAGQLSAYARFFYEQLGFNVLLPHARGHGGSGGNYIGFGWPDRLDYLKWIEWVKSRTAPGGAGARIVLFGISMGAATVLMTGGENPPPEVKAIVEDCGYTSVEEELRHQMLFRYHIRSERLLKATGALTRKRAGYSFEEASSLNQVKKIALPTLFIHGDADTFVPFRMVYSLYEACTAEKELYVIKGAGHGMAYDVDGKEYEKRVIQFVKKYLQ
ncbi:MAG: alpha/beta hydrolase [Spirochaetaceae bacterium]|nr:alpha/beta hydrolase [Spirochaetaceae bacterium]